MTGWVRRCWRRATSADYGRHALRAGQRPLIGERTGPFKAVRR